MYVLYSQNCDHILILFCNVISQWISFNTFPLDLESQSVGHSAVSDSLRPQWTVARQAPLSMGFSRQEYWSVLPFPSPGRETLLLGLLTQESNLGLLHHRQMIYQQAMRELQGQILLTLWIYGGSWLMFTSLLLGAWLDLPSLAKNENK